MRPNQARDQATDNFFKHYGALLDEALEAQRELIRRAVEMGRSEVLLIDVGDRRIELAVLLTLIDEGYKTNLDQTKVIWGLALGRSK